MTKGNIQTTTRALKNKSKEMLKQIKVLQDEVLKSLTGMREIENDLIEKKKEENQRKRAEELASAERLTAYVMPDDPEEEMTSGQSRVEKAELSAVKNNESESNIPSKVVKIKQQSNEGSSDSSSAQKKKTDDQPEIIYPFNSASGAKPKGTYVRQPQQTQGNHRDMNAQGARPARQGQGNRQNAQTVRGPRTANAEGGGQSNSYGQFNRDTRAQSGQTHGSFGQSARNNERAQPSGQKRGGTSAASPVPSVSKERVSNYDPNRNNYSRNYDNERRSKNRKSELKAAPPSMIMDDEQRGSRRRKNKKMQQAAPKIEPIRIEHVVLTSENTTVKELSEKIGKPAAEIIKKLFLLGIMATINQEIDFDTCELIASEYDITLELNVAKTAEEVMIEEAEMEDDDEAMEPRPPVVTIMGHVDHGKTSLLDAIRQTRVTQGEAGGITQHIGAYTVELNDRVITFLDTPGHEAFTSMRARGAQATDIAILVVAADDGIMPQTVEAINHAKAADVPIIVAINKIDKPEANPDRVKQQLTEHGLVVEEWGGEVIAVPVSAKTKDNLDTLLEMILLVADVQELKANPNRAAKGIVIEAELDKGRGPVATVLVKNGTLRVGDNIIAGTSYGRVRAMVNDKGERIEEVKPGYPAEVLGFNQVPDAGDILNSVAADQIRAIADERKDKIKVEKMQALARVSLDNLFSQIAEGQVKDLNVIVKADVQGSVEAVKQSMEKLSNDEVRVCAIHGGVGAITETDVMFASASNAIIIGFNVRPEPQARDAAERENVDMRLYRVIYNAIEDIEKAMKGLLEPEFEEIALGRAEIRNVFKVTGVGTIAGSFVQEGKIQRNAQVRIVRDGIVVHEGKISSLKRFKDDVKEVATGYECGIGIENYNDVKESDIIECFEMKEIIR